MPSGEVEGVRMRTWNGRKRRWRLVLAEQHQLPRLPPGGGAGGAEAGRRRRAAARAGSRPARRASNSAGPGRGCWRRSRSGSSAPGRSSCWRGCSRPTPTTSSSWPCCTRRTAPRPRRSEILKHLAALDDRDGQAGLPVAVRPAAAAAGQVRQGPARRGGAARSTGWSSWRRTARRAKGAFGTVELRARLLEARGQGDKAWSCCGPTSAGGAQAGGGADAGRVAGPAGALRRGLRPVRQRGPLAQMSSGNGGRRVRGAAAGDADRGRAARPRARRWLERRHQEEPEDRSC